MKRTTQMLSRLGCLISVVAPIVGLVVYPTANWLFWFVLVGIPIVVVDLMTSKDPLPQEVAEFAERLLNGNFSGWDVDNYEHLKLRDPRLKDLWLSTMSIGGLPEEWAGLNEKKKNELREVIDKLRLLEHH
jgi:hypothetical protein